ncbi:MAG: hypothetical protein R6X20_02945 [Phycisphaerae bacterium]
MSAPPEGPSRHDCPTISRRVFLTGGLGAVAGGMAVGYGVRPAEAADRVTAEDRAVSEPSPVRLGWRVWPDLWRRPEVYRRLLATFNAFPGAVDEVALFDAFVHAPGEALEKVRQKAATLKERLQQARSAGLDGAGINVIATLGHGIQGGLRDLPLPPLVSHEGRRSPACVCPNAPEVHAYLADYMRAMAGAVPDILWVDDDFRSITGGMRYPCFCERCLKAFGHGTDRKALVERLNDPAGEALRREWSEFYAESLTGLAKVLREAVHEVDPTVQLGLMTVGYSIGTYANYPITRLMEALDASRGRPGHGYYHDDRPRAILDKAMDVGRQVRDYPERVRWAQYELECWPYVTLDKSVRTVINECTLAMMVGCNGVLFNCLWERATHFDELHPLFSGVAAHRPVWERLVAASRGLPLVGFWPADTVHLMARRRVDRRGWFHRDSACDIQRPNALADVGLPLTVYPEAACGTLLSGRVAEGFSDDALRRVLAGAVLMDAEALSVLHARGLGNLTGVRPGRALRHCYEHLTDHPLNGPGTGDGRRGFPDTRVVPLEPLSDRVAVLSEARHEFDARPVGPCLTAYENDAGGRVAVASYVPWEQLGRLAKRRQLLNLADWLTRRRTPVRIDACRRVAPFVRRSRDGRRMVVLLVNMSFDDTGPFTLRLRGRPGRVEALRRNGGSPLVARQEGAETCVEVPSIRSWDTLFLLARGEGEG